MLQRLWCLHAQQCACKKKKVGRLSFPGAHVGDSVRTINGHRGKSGSSKSMPVAAIVNQKPRQSCGHPVGSSRNFVCRNITQYIWHLRRLHKSWKVNVLRGLMVGVGGSHGFTVWVGQTCRILLDTYRILQDFVWNKNIFPKKEGSTEESEDAWPYQRVRLSKQLNAIYGKNWKIPNHERPKDDDSWKCPGVPSGNNRLNDGRMHPTKAPHCFVSEGSQKFRP